MSVETNLRAAMADAVAPTHPDIDELVSASRRRGLGIRRRRQVLGSVGVAAAIGLAVLAPSVVAGDRGTETGPAASSGTTPASIDLTDTSPFTGRSTAAALQYATLEVAPDGRTSHVAWQGPGDNGSGETYARFRLALPGDAENAGEVGVNVQPGFGGKAAQDVSTCSDWMRSCTVDRRADGSVLVTYEDVSTYGSGGYRVVASLLRADRVRVVASASNGIDVTERDERITREAPPLTAAQLVAIVDQPWWGPELPTSFARAGEKLEGEGISARLYATSDPTPAP